MLDVYNSSSWRQISKQSPLRHGQYTSPHLIDRWDCITIDQKTVPLRVFDEVETDVLERNRKDSIRATEFELLTATAFEIFTREEVDVGVVEVGLGGRLDATNVLGQAPIEGIPEGFDMANFRPPPLVSVISSIGLDHQGFLGNTLEDIAREKAGIMKPGVPVLYDESNGRSVVEILEEVAAENNSPVINALSHPLEVSPETNDLLHAGMSMLQKDSKHTDDSAIPNHTKNNLTVAFLATWTALQDFHRLNFTVDQVTARRGPESHPLYDLAMEMFVAAKTTTFPGRQQHINIEKLTGRKGTVLLDGAHNAQSAQALASEIEKTQLRHGNRDTVTWVVAASDSKDVKQILSPLLRDGDGVFAVEFGPVSGMPWVKPLEASRLLEAAKAVVPTPDSLSLCNCRGDVLGALKAATEHAAGGSMVVVGSLYLVGDVLRLLRDSQ